MEQIPFLYFMRVILTVFGGFFLAHQVIIEKFPKLQGLYDFLNTSATSRLALAFSNMLIGIVSLILGRVYLDFFPSVLAIMIAIIMFYEEHTANTNSESVNSNNTVTRIFVQYGIQYKMYWGLAALFFGLLHIFSVRLAFI
ncbi:hypothetical protein PVA45_00875 [Entomospira entomophila]|uniref:Uncharacterized protein n=1 Tax=Entomospira entomophila TaxID=2719988 RepID=A0A968GAH1_9SPIO|nr:hypothetical protein [Entomospira entomophilus]NIZ40073.1 hypothetical protein [Entomospira entomophilus]WDI35634.1 hypothetical protein PVA45_00875 [Entomospira entomophilus]